MLNAWMKLCIYYWSEWTKACAEAKCDPWATDIIVVDVQGDDVDMAYYKGERPERPADHDEAPAYLSADCIYCHRPLWKAESADLGDGEFAHKECRDAVHETARESKL